MTLIVGAVRGEQGVLVADTKVTFGVRGGVVDERERPPRGYASVLDANRAEYKNSVSKIVILDRHLAVGYAGDDPIAKIKHLVGLRGRSVEQVLDELAAIPEAHYVVLADGESLRLWQVRHDEVDERTTSTGRAWAGDQDAYSVFQGPFYSILVLPILFAAGMCLMDTVDGVFMNVAYGWAFARPVRKERVKAVKQGNPLDTDTMIGAQASGVAGRSRWTSSS